MTKSSLAANPLEPNKSDFLSALSHVSHGFFGRQGGVSEGIFSSLNCGPGSGDDPSKIEINRSRATDHIELEAGALVSLYQIHSNKCILVQEPWANASRPEADGMVTDRHNIALGILTADCGPILFADKEAEIIGAAHAGWQGALSGIVESTVSTMEKLGAKRSRIIAALGPTISQRAYQVGPEFEERFTNKNKDFGQFFEPSSKPDFWQFDLPAFIRRRLLEAGILNPDISGQCTYEDKDGHFSFRRTTHMGEPDYGRNISVIALADRS